MRECPIGRRLFDPPRPLFGLLIVEVASPGLLPALEVAGVDFVMIDMEHGPFSYRDVASLLAGARSTNVAALVRVPELTRSAVGRVLDLGADGVVAPRVESAADARRLVEWGRYGPEGSRNAAFALAHDGYRRGNVPDTAARANAGAACVALVETVAGVDAIDDLISVPGLDAVIFGGTDLSQSLGAIGDMSSQPFLEREARVLEACLSAGVALGVVARGSEAIAAALTRGYRPILLGSELSLIQTACAEAITWARSIGVSA